MIFATVFLSKNQLNRIIKKATNTTVWSYITAKRLIYANELLYQGTPPLKTCAYCGFFNYPTFYKAYKKYFGHAPSADYVRKKAVDPVGKGTKRGLFAAAWRGCGADENIL